VGSRAQSSWANFYGARNQLGKIVGPVRPRLDIGERLAALIAHDKTGIRRCAWHVFMAPARVLKWSGNRTRWYGRRCLIIAVDGIKLRDRSFRHGARLVQARFHDLFQMAHDDSERYTDLRK
jgi:hypothetical protein